MMTAHYRKLNRLIKEHSALPLHAGWLFCRCELAERIRSLSNEGEAQRETERQAQP